VKLEYHSQKQIDEANAHFAEFLKREDFNPEKDLNQDEKKWIKNEKILCMCDYVYWAEHYTWIVDKQNRLIRFRPYKAQRINIDIRASLEREGRALEFINLKARQLGISTEYELASAHRVQFYSHINAVIGSSDPDKSEEMSRMMEICWANQPWFLMPEMTVRKAGQLFEFGNQNSRVSIQHGTQFSGIARGTTPTVVHLSEICDFEDPKHLIDASLLRAVHPYRWDLMAFESTAQGRHNWWHQTWDFSKENWDSGMARLKPIFLPWFISDDIYPTPTEARTRPVPKDWQPASIVIKHAEKCQQYAHSDPLLRKYLGDNWKMPLEKMWWWWYTRCEYESKKELAQFYAEVASSDDECFQNDTTSVFNVDLISSYRESCPEPLGVFGIIGEQSQIPYRLWPDRREIDDSKPRIEITANWSSRSHGTTYDLVPVRFTGYANFNPDMKLLIYEWPEDDEEYAFGVDTAEGIGLDRTAVEVLRKGSLLKNDKLCAELVSHWLSAFDVWPHCLAIGTLYSTMIRGKLKQARAVIECRSNGENTQNEIRKRGWRHFHPWLRYDAKRIRVDQARKIGWFTNQWSRDLMTDWLIKSLRDGWLDIPSPYFVYEMADFQKDEYAQSLRATYGGHDDRLMALGMALISLHVLEIRGTKKSIFEQRMEMMRDPDQEEEQFDWTQYRDTDMDGVLARRTIYARPKAIGARW